MSSVGAKNFPARIQQAGNKISEKLLSAIDRIANYGFLGRMVKHRKPAEQSAEQRLGDRNTLVNQSFRHLAEDRTGSADQRGPVHSSGLGTCEVVGVNRSNAGVSGSDKEFTFRPFSEEMKFGWRDKMRMDKFLGKPSVEEDGASSRSKFTKNNQWTSRFFHNLPGRKLSRVMGEDYRQTSQQLRANKDSQACIKKHKLTTSEAVGIRSCLDVDNSGYGVKAFNDILQHPERNGQRKVLVDVAIKGLGKLPDAGGCCKVINDNKELEAVFNMLRETKGSKGFALFDFDAGVDAASSDKRCVEFKTLHGKKVDSFIKNSPTGKLLFKPGTEFSYGGNRTNAQGAIVFTIVEAENNPP